MHKRCILRLRFRSLSVRKNINKKLNQSALFDFFDFGDELSKSLKLFKTKKRAIRSCKPDPNVRGIDGIVVSVAALHITDNSKSIYYPTFCGSTRRLNKLANHFPICTPCRVLKKHEPIKKERKIILVDSFFFFFFV